QTMYDCLHEAMDIDGLRAVVQGLESGRIEVTCRDTTEPSPLCHEIVNGRPYTYLDDAPLEDRRTRPVTLPPGLPVDAPDLPALAPDARGGGRAAAKPDRREEDGLPVLLLWLVLCRPGPAWQEWFQMLTERGRATVVDRDGTPMWCATEQLDQVAALDTVDR